MEGGGSMRGPWITCFVWAVAVTTSRKVLLCLAASGEQRMFWVFLVCAKKVTWDMACGNEGRNGGNTHRAMRMCIARSAANGIPMEDGKSDMCRP